MNDIIGCMPTRGQVTLEAFVSIVNSFAAFRTLLVSSRLPVDQARNELAAAALAIVKNTPLPMETLILSADDDSAWEPEMLDRAARYMQDFPKIDLLSGNFTARSRSAPSWHWPRLDPSNGSNISPALVEIQSCGFHWVVYRAGVLERVGPNAFSNIDGLSEDLSFCKRARDRSVRMFCAEDILIPHVDADRGLMYLPDRAPIPLPGELGPTENAWKRRSYGARQDAERLKYPPTNDEFDGSFDDSPAIAINQTTIVPLVMRTGLASTPPLGGS